jgi:hypothetical protein
MNIIFRVMGEASDSSSPPPKLIGIDWSILSVVEVWLAFTCQKNYFTRYYVSQINVLAQTRVVELSGPSKRQIVS